MAVLPHENGKGLFGPPPVESSQGRGEQRVLPLTLVHHPERRGYAASVQTLFRTAIELTDRPKRDCAILMHADFTHSPQVIPDLVRRIESGADLVVAEFRPPPGSHVEDVDHPFPQGVDLRHRLGGGDRLRSRRAT